MSDVALVYTTVSSRAEAEAIAEVVLAERLAACVNILAGCSSVYRWQGKIERGDEVPILAKTAPALVSALRARIEALHPYDMPAIEAWPAAASDAVTDWVAAETG